ncbi:peptidylprolyl isomerase [Persicobacter psychrovividus]|uniref:Peptidylprolyl isomerase n=1 Tax=Persicobacter psychrovividus TaxID=387638 RepID=A0ABM7VGE5_9BACT|nr:peptidylprolyl isomerase [Persicobacter psychrovividus]
MKLKFFPLLLSSFIIFCVSGLSSRAYAQDAVVADKIIAKVDNYIVLKSELERAYLEYLSQGKMNSGMTKCKMLESLIVDKLMVAKAEIDSVEVSDDQVNGELDRRMAYFVQQVGGEEKIQEYYGKSVEDFKEELYDRVKEDITKQTMHHEITKDITVTPNEVRKFFRHIPQDSLPYYSTEVKLAQIVKDPKPNEEEEQVARETLLDIKKKVLAGGSFEEFAKKYSQDPGSGAFGGNLGWMSRGKLVPEYEEAAMTMKKGEISDPIKSDFGYHLIQLIDRRGNEFNSRHILIKPKVSDGDIEVAEHYLDSLRTLIVADSIKFEPTAKEESDDQHTANTGGYFTDQSDGNIVSVEALDPTIFFTIDTMKVGSVSKPIRYRKQDGTEAVRILYFSKKVAPHVANLKDDYLKIQQAALNKKQGDKVSKWFKTAKDDVFIQVADEYKDCGILDD